MELKDKSQFDGNDINKADNSIVAALNMVVGEDYKSLVTEEYSTIEKIIIEKSNIQTSGRNERRICGIITTNKEHVVFVQCKIPNKGNTAIIPTLRIYKFTEMFINNNSTTNSPSLELVIEFQQEILADYNSSIEGVYRYNNKGELIVVWAGNNIVPGLLNIDVALQQDSITTNYGMDIFKSGLDATTKQCNSISEEYLAKLFPTYKVCSFERIDFIPGGRIKTGVYQFVIAYMIGEDYGICSLPTNPLTAVEVNNLGEEYLPSIVDGDISKSIKLYIEDLDTNYKKFKLFRIYKHDGITTCNSAGTYTITDSVKTIIYNTDSDEENVDISRVIIPTVTFDNIKTITNINNQVDIANLISKPRIPYQPYALDITANYLVTYADELQDFDGRPLTHSTAIYTKGNVQVNFKTAMPEEVMALYIGFNLKDGTKTEGYHIPGRPAKKFATIGGHDYWEHDLFGQTANWANPTSSGLNTMPTTLSELIHLSIKHSPKIYQVYDTCTASIQTEMIDGVPYERVTSGEMSFWENRDEVYPDTDDFISHNATDFRGKNVRHHKMPSINFLKNNIAYVTLPPEEQYPLPAIYNNKQMILGVSLSNIVIPEEYIDVIDSIWIGYGERTIGNITIQGMTPVIPPMQYINCIDGVAPAINNSNGKTSSIVFNDSNLILNKPNVSFDYIRPQFYIASNNNVHNNGFTVGGWQSDDAMFSGTILDYNQSISPINFTPVNHAGGEIMSIESHKYMPDNNLAINPYKSQSLLCNLNTYIYSYYIFSVDPGNPNVYNHDARIPICTIHSIKRNVFMDFRSQKIALTFCHRSITIAETIDDLPVQSFDTFIGNTDNAAYMHPGSTNAMWLGGYHLPNTNKGDASLKPWYPIKHNHFYMDMIEESSPSNPDDFTNLGWGLFVEGSVAKLSKGNPMLFNLGTRIFDLSLFIKIAAPVYSIMNLDYKDYNLDGNIDFRSHVKMKYNMDYSTINNIYPLLAFDDRRIWLKEHPNRIHSSIIAKEDENLISWRTFLAMDYYDMPNDRGAIMSLSANNNQLIIRQRYSMYVAMIKDVLRSLDANNTPIDAYLGVGNIFDRRPDEVLTSEKGSIQCNSQFTGKSTERGYIGIDDIQGKVFIFSNKYEEISRINKEFFKYFFNFNSLHLDNPYYLDGLAMEYDSLNERLYISKTYVINPNYITDSNFPLYNIGEYPILPLTNDVYLENGIIKYIVSNSGDDPDVPVIETANKNIVPSKIQISIDMNTGFISLRDRVVNTNTYNPNGFYAFDNSVSNGFFKASIVKPRQGSYEADSNYVDILINKNTPNIKILDALRLQCKALVKSSAPINPIDKLIVYNENYISELVDMLVGNEFYDNEHGFNKEGIINFNNILNQFDNASGIPTNVSYKDYAINNADITTATKYLPILNSGNLVEFYEKSLFTGSYFVVRIYFNNYANNVRKCYIFGIEALITDKPL